MPFDDPQEQEDEALMQPSRLRPMYPDSRQTALVDDDQTSDLSTWLSLSSQQFPVTDAQFQRRFGAPPQAIPKPSIGQRILALGQKGASLDQNEIETSAVPGSIGDRIVQMTGQRADSLLPRLTTKPGIPGQVSAFNQMPTSRGLFSNFVPVGGDKSVNPQASSLSTYSPTLLASTELGQMSEKPTAGQQMAPAPSAGATSVVSSDTKRQQNRDGGSATATGDQDEDDLSPSDLAPTKVKPSEDVRTGDWSGGEAAPGQSIVKSAYHTDYSARGKRKIGGDRSWRNNNPGNIKYSKSSPACKGAIGHDYGGFAVFDTMQAGMRAQDTLWRTPMYQNMTLRQAVLSWTKNDPPQTQGAYLQDLIDKTHVTADTKVSAFNESQLQRLQEAQRKHEGGQKGRIVDISKPKASGKGK